MSVGTILLIFLILLLCGAIPSGGYGLGNNGIGALGVVLIIVVVLLALGRI